MIECVKINLLIRFRALVQPYPVTHLMIFNYIDNIDLVHIATIMVDIIVVIRMSRLSNIRF